MRSEVDKLEEVTFDNFKELPFLIATFNEVSPFPSDYAG